MTATAQEECQRLEVRKRMWQAREARGPETETGKPARGLALFWPPSFSISLSLSLSCSFLLVFFVFF